MDFNIEIYEILLKTLKHSGYLFRPFNSFINTDESMTVILRHDVDLLPGNSLRFAKIQAQIGVKGSYYFRAVPESWNENIIKEISEMEHEIGYHYETMDTAKGDVDKAWDQFRFHLDALRKLVDVNTICMHGSPRSKFDNKEIWKKYDYKTLGIIGEPYYDVDFDKVFYLTDTGRRWDGWKTSVRDKVPQQEEWNKLGLTFHSTQDIIKALENRKSEVSSERRVVRGEYRELSIQKSEVNIKESESELLLNKKAIPFTGLPLGRGKDSKRDGFFSQNIEKGSLSSVEVPNQVMFTMHPQRWHDSSFPWLKELVMQNVKNVVKRVLYVNK